jgi:hypothetical protein
VQAELAVLQAKRREADTIDAYTIDQILATPALLKDFGKRTYNEDICDFIANGPHGNKDTYVKFIEKDAINLEGAREVRNAFRDLAANEKKGVAVDWSKAPWEAAYRYVVRDLKAAAGQLLDYKTQLKTARGLN